MIVVDNKYGPVVKRSASHTSFCGLPCDRQMLAELASGSLAASVVCNLALWATILALSEPMFWYVWRQEWAR